MTERKGKRVVKTTTTTTNDDLHTTAKVGSGIGLGVIAVIVAIVLAIGGWLYFNGKPDTASSVSKDVGEAAGSIYDKAKDAVTPDKPASTPAP